MKFNLLTCVFALLIIYFIFQIREDVLRFNELANDSVKFSQKLSEIKATNLDLIQRLAKLKQAYFIEELARERLNLVKKGETAYKVCL